MINFLINVPTTKLYPIERINCRIGIESYISTLLHDDNCSLAVNTSNVVQAPLLGEVRDEMSPGMFAEGMKGRELILVN